MVRKKRIAIDARMYGLEHGGIGRYIINLVKNLRPEIKRYDFFLLVKKEKLEEIKTELGDGFKYVPVLSRHYSLAEQVELPCVLWKLKPDLVHFPHFNTPIFYLGNYVVTIHDLIKHYFYGSKTTTQKALFYWLKHFFYRLVVFFAIKKAAIIFTPSNYWRDELIKRFKLDSKKVKVTYEGVDSTFSPLHLKKNEPPFLKDTKSFRDFFIYTGNAYPHKNLETLLRAIARLKDINLVLVCSRDAFSRRIEEMARKVFVDERILFLGFVSDKELVRLYKKAIALVQPSLMEGFGLTGLEAMACGCPVLAANASCLPEIYGSGALYFNPFDEKDLAKKMLILKKRNDLRIRLIKKGREQVRRYSWKKMALETIAGYEKALSLGV